MMKLAGLSCIGVDYVDFQVTCGQLIVEPDGLSTCAVGIGVQKHASVQVRCPVKLVT